MGRLRAWRTATLVIGAGLVAVSGCSSDDDPVATVLVDYDHDEFATQFIRFFPEEVQVHPGDRVTFRQHWTGEPHTVTLGSIVDEVLEVTRPLIAEYGDRPESEVPGEVLEEFFAAESQLPCWYCGPEPEGDGEEGADEADDEADDEGDAPPTEDANGVDAAPPLPQALAQPCVVASGDFPASTADPCADQDLGPFDGTEAYYNSGIIPYEGPGGNTFVLELADDIEPGSYGFYCAVHGSFQSGRIEVLDPSEEIRSPDDNAVALRRQVEGLLEPYEVTFREAVQGRYSFAGEDHDWNYAGLLRDDAPDEGIINEFLPAVIDAEVDEPITWRVFGPHSISFDVPEYFPIVEFLDDGTVRSNDAVFEPAGGAPPIDREEPEEEEPPEPWVIDGGTWEGEGFWSSGVVYAEPYTEYTLRIAQPGTYRYACLIHPPMVGTIRVTG